MDEVPIPVTIELDFPDVNDLDLPAIMNKMPSLEPMKLEEKPIPPFLPMLTDPISSNGETKARTVFFITFFNSEQRRDQLARHGYVVQRVMRGTSTANYAVLYTFPKLDTIEAENIIIRSENPFPTRDRLFNAFLKRYQHLRRKEVILAARNHLESTLNPDQLQAIAELDPAGLDEVFRSTRP